MIGRDRALVYRWHMNRLTWASLGCYLIRRRCSRQRKLANPVIKKGQTLKKYLNIRQLSKARFAVFVTVFFLFLQRLYFAICRKNPLVQFSVSFVHILLCPYWIGPWHLFRGEKKTGLHVRFPPSLSSCLLALVAPPPKQLETPTSEPARRLVYRSSGDSRYLVIH